MGEDILDPYGGAFKVTKGLSSEFSDQVIPMPISEATIAGVGTGLALKKHNVISEIMFGDFLTLCTDQIVNGMSKFIDLHEDKKILGRYLIRAPMGGYRGYGPTHSQSLESIFLNIPNLSIFSPNIFSKPNDLLEKIFLEENFSIFIEHKVSYSKQLLPKKRNNFDIKINNHDYFDIIEVFDGIPDYEILTYGHAAEIALDSILDIFLKTEKKGKLVILKKIKPIDYIFDNHLKSTRLIILEEGIEENGWGNYFYKYFSLKKRSFDEILHIGSKNTSIPSSIKKELEHLPSVDKCVKKIMKILI